jgi:hypothetical protein
MVSGCGGGKPGIAGEGVADGVDGADAVASGAGQVGEVSDTLKYFSERIPATFVYAGINVEREGLSPAPAASRSPAGSA